ncbi:MAG: hypothetical protein QM723_06435 [Myxococcaceae bacterium]
MRKLAILFLAVGCTTPSGSTKTEDKPKGSSAAEFYPLTVGNSWTYHVKALGEEREQTITIQGEEGGFLKDNAGNELTTDAYGVRDKLRYLLREPVEPGNHWTNVVSASSIEDYKIVSVESCTVPAGTFPRCAIVESRNKADPKHTLINTFTFAAGVGIVRIETELLTGQDKIPQVRLELQKYSLAPKPGETPSH